MNFYSPDNHSKQDETTERKDEKLKTENYKVNVK